MLKPTIYGLGSHIAVGVEIFIKLYGLVKEICSFTDI